MFCECGCCGQLHPVNWQGDCRDDSNRYHPDELDAIYGEGKWTEVELSEVPDYYAYFFRKKRRGVIDLSKVWLYARRHEYVCPHSG